MKRILLLLGAVCLLAVAGCSARYCGRCNYPLKRMTHDKDLPDTRLIECPYCREKEKEQVPSSKMIPLKYPCNSGIQNSRKVVNAGTS